MGKEMKTCAGGRSLRSSAWKSQCNGYGYVSEKRLSDIFSAAWHGTRSLFLEPKPLVKMVTSKSSSGKHTALYKEGSKKRPYPICKGTNTSAGSKVPCCENLCQMYLINSCFQNLPDQSSPLASKRVTLNPPASALGKPSSPAEVKKKLSSWTSMARVDEKGKFSSAKKSLFLLVILSRNKSRLFVICLCINTEILDTYYDI